MDHDAALKRAHTPGTLVWHYTSLDTLALILRSNALLATEVGFQNDIRETETADEAFTAALEELKRDAKYGLFASHALQMLGDLSSGRVRRPSRERDLLEDARFILCASDDPDSLYAWRTYASGGIGCAIGLDPEIPLGVVDPREGTHRMRHWRKVRYKPEEIRDIALTVLSSLGHQWNIANARDAHLESSGEAFLLLLRQLTVARSHVRAYAKDASFEDEHEQRITLETVSLDAVLFTPSSMGPRPHVQIVGSEGHRFGISYRSAAAAKKLPIRAVRLGPGAPDSAVTSAEWLLVANGYGLDPIHVVEQDDDGDFHDWEDWTSTVVIDRSSHPYRSR